MTGTAQIVTIRTSSQADAEHAIANAQLTAKTHGITGSKMPETRYENGEIMIIWRPGNKPGSHRIMEVAAWVTLITLQQLRNDLDLRQRTLG